MKVVTICARNYLPYARVLARSFRQTNPQDEFVTLLIDLLADDEVPTEDFEVVGPSVLELDDDDFARMTFMYDVTELATALKPWALQWVLDGGHDVAVYIDPDIAVFDSLQLIAEPALKSGIALTPHRLTAIPRDGLRPDESDIMCSGIQNLGFIAVSDKGRPWLEFWKARLLTDSVVDLPNQLFTDQRWTDWIPALFDYVKLADPGLNVAYWNLDERGLERSGDNYTCNGHPLRFFHFSGYRPSQPWCLSKYISDAPRVVVSEHPALIPMLTAYDEQLRAEGLYDPDQEAYRFGTFADGAVLSRGIRRLYRKEFLDARRPRRTSVVEEPPLPDYREGFSNLRSWLAEPSNRMPALSRLAYSIWASRVDLQGVFPEPQTASREAYGAWLAEFGVSEGYLTADWATALQPIDVTPLPLALEPGCNVFGYLSSILGVGSTGRSIVEAAKRSGLPLSIHSSDRTHSPRLVEFEPVETSVRYPVNIVVMNADAFPFWVQDWGPQYAPDAYTIGYWAWELETLPGHMLQAYSHVNEIWTGSEFNAEVFSREGSVPVRVFPMPVEPVPVRPAPTLDIVDPERGYFLFVFDYLSEVERKNPAGLIEAFLRAFPQDDGPDLIIKSINGEQRRTDRERIRMQAARSPRVHLLEDYLPTEELQSLTQHALAFVSLHRSEGLGLSLMEAMAQGTPVVATGYSGNVDFMTSENSILIPFEMTPVTAAGGYYSGTGEWAEPDLTSAAQAMRRLFEDRGVRTELGRRAQEDILARYSMDQAADFVHQRLSEIVAEMQAQTAVKVETQRQATASAGPRSKAGTVVSGAYQRVARWPVTRLPVVRDLAASSVAAARAARNRARKTP